MNNKTTLRLMLSTLTTAFLLLMAKQSVAQSADFSVESSPSFGKLSQFKGSSLCKVAQNTNDYLSRGSDFDTFAVHQGEMFSDDVTLARVQKTLQFICDTYRQDVRANRQSRLHDPAFLKASFEFVRWQPDRATAQQYADNSKNQKKAKLLNAIPSNQILLTKYYTKLLEGSDNKTAHFNQALYQIPNDELHLTQEQAFKQKDALIRYQFTRQQVIEGALDKKQLATPLIWLSEASLHDVLLQGTGVIKTDRTTRYFNVHRNNGISYDYTLGKTEQPRYWYFAEVPGIMGYGKDLASKIQISPHVTFAGNVKQLGLGKLIMVSFDYQGEHISRLGVLADQGGAFDDNLFQLDMLVDSFYGWSDYYQANKGFPDYAQAYILLLKNDL